MKRANLLVALGAVLVVVGLGLAWSLGRSGDDDPPDAAVPVLVAKADISPGEAGEDVVAAGKVAVEQVPASEVVTGALAATADLQGTIVATAVGEGEQVVVGAVRPATLRGEAIAIPDGMRAVAVTVPFTNGAAGYAAPGDRVDVFTTIAPGTEGPRVAPLTELLLPNVEVLDVSDEVAPRRAEAATVDGSVPVSQASRAGTEQITLLLAVDAADAERLVFAASVDQLWFGLVGEDQPDGTPSGVGYDRGYLEGDR